jgi:6-phosphogluconolactonase (cycloisomerase 2 family)
VAVDPSGKFLYVANFGVSNFTSTVSAYTIDPMTGFLTAISGSPFTAGVNPIAVAVDPSGRFAYLANNGGGNVAAYSINASSGALTQIGTPVNSGSKPDFISVDPSDKFVYVSNLFSNMTFAVFAFKIQSNGSLVGIAGSPFAGGGLPSAVVTIGIIH